MAMPCFGCTSPKRKEIDEALATGEPNRRIAARVGTSEAAIRRHKVHAEAALARAARSQEKGARTILARIEELHEHALRLMAKAERARSWSGAAAALREARACCETLAKASGELREAPPALAVVLSWGADASGGQQAAPMIEAKGIEEGAR